MASADGTWLVSFTVLDEEGEEVQLVTGGVSADPDPESALAVGTLALPGWVREKLEAVVRARVVALNGEACDVVYDKPFPGGKL